MESREKILKAALEVFAEKGKHGARMEEIATRARVNKAMLYYFYTSKENLYKEVLSLSLYDICKNIYDAIYKINQTGMDRVESVCMVVQKHFEAYRQNIEGTKIVLEAFVHEPEEIKKAIANIRSDSFKGDAGVIRPQQMIEFFEIGIQEKVFRAIDVRQIFISIMGMNLIYFMARPIAQALLGLDVNDEHRFLEERQKSISDLLLNGILAKEVGQHV